MSDGIEVGSTAALTSLKDAIASFSLRMRDLTEQSTTLATGVQRRCHALAEEARSAVREAERGLAHCSDEDRQDFESELNDATEHLRSVRHAIEGINRAFGRLRRHEIAASEASVRCGHAGAAYLGQKISGLSDYYAVSAPFSNSGSSADSEAIGIRSIAATVSCEPPTMAELEQYVLPIGWKWIALKDIDVTRIKGEELKFKGDSRQQFINRFGRLLHEVLPELDRNRSSTEDRLRRDDLRDGIHDGSGKLGTFDTFFSLDSPIHLQRAAGSTLYSIDDGRHRVEIANELGWPAVPAQTVDPETGE